MTPQSVIRFAVIGDVEPKGEVTFSNLRRTVALLNELAQDSPLTFTACIGDIAHRGSLIQYEMASAILADLSSPFYTIMGNEELVESKERFLQYAARWNAEADVIPGTCYVKEHHGIVFVFATAHQDGTTFSDHEIAWLEEQVKAHCSQPVMIFTHAPAPRVFPEAGHRTMKNQSFDRILAHANVRVVFSGHTHFDLDSTVSWAEDSHGVWHIHVPGIERTKVGTKHTPRFRLVTIQEGRVLVQTYNVFTGRPEAHHEITVPLQR